MSVQEVEESGQSAAPQEFVLNFLGLYVFGRGEREERKGAPPVATQVFLSVLGRLGISESATRAALNRMVHRSLLARHKQGRTTAFHLTEEARALLRRGRDRMFSPAPFDHSEGIWTVLSCPVPESLRNVRYHIQGRLSWAGFGVIHPNVWVAPGRVDVEEVLRDLPTQDATQDALELVQAFHGTPATPSRPEQLVQKAWDLEALRAGHLAFLGRWEDTEPPLTDALPQLLLLHDDWGRLLRADPGLPAAYLDDDWPSTRSTHTFQRLQALLASHADQQLSALLDPPSDPSAGQATTANRRSDSQAS
ncbi:PaaX family transcriptional regulator [Streptomyces umbrinus]|uniref:PaaX family transcriptional regulator n=1 Tax=Streptomyces umbrinus TaxID=67370 RepID=UPI001673C867|nr:PaaX family transcriptional regulator C-terminal domain-containing protein [Streptomyces umbrinus]GHB83271.1 PaaX family transcriptional regulator [Streptomyces umbrinus]